MSKVVRFLKRLLCLHRRECYLELVDAGTLGAKRVRVRCCDCGATRTGKAVVRLDGVRA